MKVELLWWEGCPSTAKAARELRAALADVGAGDVPVLMREVRSDPEAGELRFPGSPTILVDGADIAPVTADEPFGLSCRVYHRRDGRISPTPDPDDVRDALSRALASQEVPR